VFIIKVPELKQAEAYLNWAEKCNPGPWVAHSKVVARAAGEIAIACKLDKETAQVIGLLHDLGRYKGVTAMMHIFDGYEYLLNEGYEDAAQICILFRYKIYLYIAEKMIAQQKHTKKLILFCLMHNIRIMTV